MHYQTALAELEAMIGVDLSGKPTNSVSEHHHEQGNPHDPKSIIKRTHLFSITLALLMVASALFVTSCKKDAAEQPAASDVDYYTCTMHPSVRSQDPHGKCPICGMDLVPVKKKTAVGSQAAETNMGISSVESEAADQPGEFTVPINRQQQIGVTYATVEKQPFLPHYKSGWPGGGGQASAVGLCAAFYVEGYVQKLFVFLRANWWRA